MTELVAAVAESAKENGVSIASFVPNRRPFSFHFLSLCQIVTVTRICRNRSD